MSFPNRGEGGGSPTWEKFPHFPVFFFGQRPLYDRLLKNLSAQNMLKTFVRSLTVALLRSFAKSDDQYIGKPDALHGLTTGQYIRGKYDPRNVNPWCLSPPAVVFPGQYRRHRHSFEQTSFVSAVRRVGCHPSSVSNLNLYQPLLVNHRLTHCQSTIGQRKDKSWFSNWFHYRCLLHTAQLALYI